MEEVSQVPRPTCSKSKWVGEPGFWSGTKTVTNTTRCTHTKTETKTLEIVDKKCTDLKIVRKNVFIILMTLSPNKIDKDKHRIFSDLETCRVGDTVNYS